MGLVAIIATCETCGWTAESNNAMGIGALHAKRKGHKVAVESHYVTKFEG